MRQCCTFTCFSSLWLFVTPPSVARKAPLSMGFSKQDYWRGLLCPLPGDLPNPGIELVFSCISCIARGFFTVAPPNKPFGTHMLQNSKRIFLKVACFKRCLSNHVLQDSSSSPKRTQCWYFLVHILPVWANELREMVKNREAWCAAVHGVTKTQTGLNNWKKATKILPEIF